MAEIINPKMQFSSGKYRSVRDPDPRIGLYDAFIPNALPPSLIVSPELSSLELEASHALGSLNAIIDFLPDSNIFLYSYIRKEALLSSQIEGTQSSLSDLLLFESTSAPGVPINDVEEVSSYISSLRFGQSLIKSGDDFSKEMLQELHRQLLEKGRGKNKQPGVIRTKQNWVGGNRPGDAQYVPPPDDEIDRLLENLIVFMNRRDVSMPSIRKAGIAHVQFESIHPFYDGNGRIGRMIISLLLSAEGLLKEPLLYLSLYLKMNRYRYYELLQTVREKSDWQQWLIFFCTGVTEVARSALQTAQKLLELFNDDARRIQTVGGRSFGLMIQVHNIFKEKIIVQPKQIVIESRLSPPTVSKILRVLTELGIIKEISGKQRNSVYAYQKYLDILAEGAEPIEG